MVGHFSQGFLLFSIYFLPPYCSLWICPDDKPCCRLGTPTLKMTIVVNIPNTDSKNSLNFQKVARQILVAW